MLPIAFQKLLVQQSLWPKKDFWLFYLDDTRLDPYSSSSKMAHRSSSGDPWKA